jgi:hypothetical protein
MLEEEEEGMLCRLSVVRFVFCSSELGVLEFSLEGSLLSRAVVPGVGVVHSMCFAWNSLSLSELKLGREKVEAREWRHGRRLSTVARCLRGRTVAQCSAQCKRKH